MASSWFFHFQKEGKESRWEMALGADREAVLRTGPAFSTVLDLSGVPDDGDWSKVRYRGPFYADFDSDDLGDAIEGFNTVLLKLEEDFAFDATQARLYATGGRGFHIEIPQECFIPKPAASGYPWLPYVYRAMAEAVVVDTMDLNVYTGKKGRMWRTPNVERDNGCFKVPITLADARDMTPELYAELISEPRPPIEPAPAVCSAKFAALFERSREKVVKQLSGKKKRVEKANAFLEPWKRQQKTPPTIEAIMAGENLADGARFQSIAMQLAIYATSVGMESKAFLERCRGLCENHVSDSKRYNTFAKRQEELQRMYDYFLSDSLYDFDTGPLVRLLKSGTPAPDLGIMQTEDVEDTPTRPAEPTTDSADGDPEASDNAGAKVEDDNRIRKGFFMNADGMWRKQGDNIDSLCRATFRNVEAFLDFETGGFSGYEFDLFARGKKMGRHMLPGESFASAAAMKKFLAIHQLGYQGTDADTTALLDIMSEKAARGGKVHTYYREGFMIMNHPEIDEPTPVKVYLTRDAFMCSIPEDDPNFFVLRYRAKSATSSYDIDIHKASPLAEEHIPTLHDLFRFNKPNVVADLVGWFVACHYRSAYLRLFSQFPLLQVWGEAGAGKSQTIKMLGSMHWNNPERVTITSAMSCTPFAMDSRASSSTSAPFLIDEYKPRELKRAPGGKYEKIKDVLKASYIGSDIGERGKVDKFAENSLTIIKSRATAPVCFMGEAIEMETAIIERCTPVQFSKAHHTPERTAAFERLQMHPEALSALGRAIVEMGFMLNLDTMRTEVTQIRAQIEDAIDAKANETSRRVAPRLIFNRAVILHALSVLKRVLRRSFGDEFDADIDALTGSKIDGPTHEDSKVEMLHGMSELSKVVSRLALLSREVEGNHRLIQGRDYMIGAGTIELMLERCYDKYRIYCAHINDTPLFDTLDAFIQGFGAYSPAIDRECHDSKLRPEGSSEHVVRLSIPKLFAEGVQTFYSS